MEKWIKIENTWRQIISNSIDSSGNINYVKELSTKVNRLRKDLEKEYEPVSKELLHKWLYGPEPKFKMDTHLDKELEESSKEFEVVYPLSSNKEGFLRCIRCKEIINKTFKSCPKCGYTKI